MIFSTLNQFNNFLIFIIFGLIFGLIRNIFYTIFLIEKNIEIKQNKLKFLKICIFDTIFYGFFSVFFIFLLNFYNFGMFSFALLLAILIGYFWQNFLTKKLFAKLFKMWYNIVNKFKRKQNETTNKS